MKYESGNLNQTPRRAGPLRFVVRSKVIEQFYLKTKFVYDDFVKSDLVLPYYDNYAERPKNPSCATRWALKQVHNVYCSELDLDLTYKRNRIRVHCT
jgi:hypothetical protein